MDLAREYDSGWNFCVMSEFCFNPCFNGSCSRICVCAGHSANVKDCGFNPCFNGSCSRISKVFSQDIAIPYVSILVLMDLAREFKRRRGAQRGMYVSILVLMDLAREFSLEDDFDDDDLGFNPCFNGSCSRILIRSVIKSYVFSFNPCFNGSCSRIRSV